MEQLDWQILLPEGWSLAGSEGDEASTQKPTVGETSLATWSWTMVPASPFTFSYDLNAPTDATDRFELVTLVNTRTASESAQLLANPDPLYLFPRGTFHSADTDSDQRLSLSELLRVIELYNTRFGTTRTGRYRQSNQTQDGFEPDTSSPEAHTPVAVHSADTDRDGRFSLSELLRVIELYNTRSGTSRTGAYRIADGTPDGFEPDQD